MVTPTVQWSRSPTLSGLPTKAGEESTLLQQLMFDNKIVKKNKSQVVPTTPSGLEAPLLLRLSPPPLDMTSFMLARECLTWCLTIVKKHVRACRCDFLSELTRWPEPSSTFPPSAGWRPTSPPQSQDPPSLPASERISLGALLGKIDYRASSEPDFIENYFLLMHSFIEN